MVEARWTAFIVPIPSELECPKAFASRGSRVDCVSV